MVIFSIARLAKRLREGKVNEKEQTTYLVVTSVLLAFLYLPVSLWQTVEKLPYDAWQIGVSVAMHFLFLLLPLVVFIFANMKGDGKETVMRFTVMSLPAAITVGLFGTILTIIAAAIVAIATHLTTQGDINNLMMNNFWFTMATNLVLTAWMSWLLYKGGLIASGAQK